MKTVILTCVMVALLLSSGCAGRTTEASISFAWAYRAGDYVRGKPTISDGVVYVGADDNTMHAVDAETGERLWRYETDDNIISSPYFSAILLRSKYNLTMSSTSPPLSAND